MNYISREQVLEILARYGAISSVVPSDLRRAIEALPSFKREPVADVDPTGGRDPNFNFGGDP